MLPRKLAALLCAAAAAAAAALAQEEGGDGGEVVKEEKQLGTEALLYPIGVIVGSAGILFINSILNKKKKWASFLGGLN